MKTRHCEDCQYSDWYEDTNKLFCHLEHQPRFFMPKSPFDVDSGYKRKCADYKEKQHTFVLQA